MTWIKICGITNLEDAFAAVEAGANAVGFVFYENSPRNVHPEGARKIIRELPPDVEKVGVFVNVSSPRLGEIARSAGLTAIQYHVLNPGAFSTAESTALTSLPQGLKLFISLSALFFLDQAQRPAERTGILERMFPGNGVADGSLATLFLDSGTPDQPGGTGKTFDWQRAVPLADEIKGRGLKLILSGGLKVENVSRAIELLRPWGVDVSSGVEAMPGKKDRAKIRAFISSVREEKAYV